MVCVLRLDLARSQRVADLKRSRGIFSALSGVLLIFLVIIHLIIMHAVNDVSQTTYSFVSARYSNPFWRLYDWLLLTLALLHGMNGLRVVIDDYIHGRGARLTALSIAAALTVAFFMLGTITLIAFPFPSH